jgi:hypothetical protein
VVRNPHVVLPLSFCALVAITATVCAQGETEPFSSNPAYQSGSIEYDEGARTTARIADEPKSKFPLPSLPALPKPSFPKIRLIPEWNLGTKGEPEKPTAWDRFKTSAGSFFSKTKKTLMPWAADGGERQTRNARVSRLTNRSPKPKSGGKGFLSSIFQPEEEEQEIKTPNDFLSLPRVPY